MTTTLTGYGPRNSRLIFDGDERMYEQWEVKFLGYLLLKKLSETILMPLAPDASEETTAADSVKSFRNSTRALSVKRKTMCYIALYRVDFFEKVGRRKRD